jgi:predicted RNA-binding protein YlxR (DUF448 family)
MKLASVFVTTARIELEKLQAKQAIHEFLQTKKEQHQMLIRFTNFKERIVLI